MAIANLFSGRQKKTQQGVSDVYEYAEIPRPLRVQVAHILRDLLGHDAKYDLDGCLETFGEIERLLCPEYGICFLPTKPSDLKTTPDVRVIDFLLNEEDSKKVLDVVEVSFRVLTRLRASSESQSRVSQEKFDRAVIELNARFREHGIGYQYESGQIIKVDSQWIHAEVVRPALALLTAEEYAGANAEFLKAFEYHRKGDTKECLNECLKAFESTMKAICTKRNWAFKSTGAKELIDLCLKNGLMPPLIHAHIRGVRATLARGIPSIRNGPSGHGQGTKEADVPQQYCSYMLHLTATTIQFFVESERALK